MTVIGEDLGRRISVVGFACACLVVGLHVHIECESGTVAWWLHQFMVNCLGVVAVPTFFMISGFLLAGKMEASGWWPREVRKRIASLLVPYLFWNLFYLFLGMTLASVLAGFGQSFGDAKWPDLTVGTVVAALGIHPLRGTQLPFLWFVRSLFVFVLAAPVFAIAKRRWVGVTVIGLLLLFYLFLPQLLPPATDWRTHFLKYAWAKGALFFASGVYLRFNGHLFSNWRRVPTIIWLALGFGLFAFGEGHLVSFCSMVCIMLFLWRSSMFLREGGQFYLVNFLRIPGVFTAQHGFDGVDWCMASSWDKGIYGEINRGIFLPNSADNCHLRDVDTSHASVYSKICKDRIWRAMREGCRIIGGEVVVGSGSGRGKRSGNGEW